MNDSLCTFLAATLTGASQDLPLAVEWLPTRPELWLDAVKAAEVLRLGGFFSRYWMHHHQDALVWPEVVRALRRYELRNRARARHAQLHFDATMEMFGGAGIQVAPLKGAALAMTVYESESLRTVSDVDVLVRREDFERAEAVFRLYNLRGVERRCRNRWQSELIGQETCQPSVPFNRGALSNGGMITDVHWQIAYELDVGRWRADEDAIWKRATRVAASNTTLQLSAIDHFTIVLAHACQAPGAMPHQLFDLVNLCRYFGLTPESIVTDAGPPLRESSAVNQLLKALVECRTCSSFGNVTKDLFAQSLDRAKHPPVHAIASLRKVSRRRDQALFLLGYFVPSPSFYRSQSFPRALWSHWLHFFTRLAKSSARRVTHRMLRVAGRYTEL